MELLWILVKSGLACASSCVQFPPLPQNFLTVLQVVYVVIRLNWSRQRHLSHHCQFEIPKGPSVKVHTNC